MITGLLDWRDGQSKDVEVGSLIEFESSNRIRQQTLSAAWLSCLLLALILNAGCAVTKHDTLPMGRHAVTEADPDAFQWAPVVVSDLPSAATLNSADRVQDGIASKLDSRGFESSTVQPTAFMVDGQEEFALGDDVVEPEAAVEEAVTGSESGSAGASMAMQRELNGSQTAPTVQISPEIPYGPEAGNYIIEVGDQVLLKFFVRPDLNETLIVGADGVISPAIVPPLYARGKTASMLKAELANQLLARNYNSFANRNDSRSVEYNISVDDVIEVRFSILTDLSDTVTVRPDGRISLARIGEVIAEGKSPSELQLELQSLYKDQVKQPELVVIMRKTTSPNLVVDGVLVPAPIKGVSEFTVEVIKSAPRLIYVMGEVSLPSAIPYQPNMTVLRAIGSSGGTKRTANLKHVMILRSGGPCSVREMAVDLRPCRTCTHGINSHSDGGFADIPLLPNDIVLVPQTKIAKVQDWLDQYVYNLFPPLRNSSAFTVLYNNGIPAFNAGL